MNVLRTSHLKPNSIGRVPVSGYRLLRNYSNKSMEWITYCEKITGVSYRHAWSDGGEMYLKKAKAWADAYYKSHVMNTSWPSWDVISMDVRRVLIVNNEYSFE